MYTHRIYVCISNYHINQPFILCFANVKRLCPRSKTPPSNVQGTKPSKSLGSTIGSSQGHMATKPRGNTPQFGLMVSLCFKKQNCWLLKLWTCFGKNMENNISQTRITVCGLEHQLGVEHLENCHRIPQHFQTEKGRTMALLG